MFAKNKSSKNVYILIMEQIKDVKTCLIYFESFMRAACTPDAAFETLRPLAGSVSQTEATADNSLRRMIDSLSGGSLLPSTREDLISIATSCDRVANKCEGISNMVMFQKFRFPVQYEEDITNMLSIIHEQFDVLEKSIGLLFAKFGDLLKDHSILDEIRTHESAVDKIEQKLYEQIFAMDLDLAERTQIAHFIEQICDISDIIENIADKIQIMLITRKA